MIHFACVNVGTAYSPEYTSRLYRGIKRHFKGEWDFTAIVDHPDRTTLSLFKLVYDKVLDIPKPEKIKNFYWWAKLNIFRDDIWPKGETVVYIDLDSIVVNNLKPLTEIQGFGMIDWGAFKHPVGSGVMVFKAGMHTHLYRDFDIRQRHKWPRGDQKYIGGKIKKITSIGPTLVASYKRHQRQDEHGDEAIVAFHGRPRPHELDRESWAYKEWVK